jgi:hypothetical protein
VENLVEGNTRGNNSRKKKYMMDCQRNRKKKKKCRKREEKSRKDKHRKKCSGPCSRGVQDEGLLPIAYWEYRFESRRRHGCLSLVSVVCCQVEVSAAADPSSRGVLPTVLCHCV